MVLPGPYTKSLNKEDTELQKTVKTLNPPPSPPPITEVSNVDGGRENGDVNPDVNIHTVWKGDTECTQNIR